MEFRVTHGSLTEAACDVLIINLFEGVKQPGGGTDAVDKALDGAISDLIREEEFEGRLGDIAIVRSCGRIPARKVLLVGLGKQEDFRFDVAMRASASVGRKCRKLRAARVASILHGAGIGGMPVFDAARALTLGTILGTYEYTRLKTENVKPNPIESFDIVELSAEKLGDIEQGIRRAEVIGDAIVFARDLVNEPSNVITPSQLADIAEEIAREGGLECRVRGRREIEEDGMGLLAAVARGSAVEPRFIEMRYFSPESAKTVAIVGKGITFDTGGYSLKPQDSMYGMKDDMAGAAASLAAMRAVARIKPKVNVIALIPATENAIGANAIHPGDVFISHGGKSVEVNNTDAEGRLILADAVAYAARLGVDEIIDAATLTGACVVALGREISGIFGNRDDLVDGLIEAGRRCGENMWRLPLHTEYKDQLKSNVADIKNTAGREGAAIHGALFIESFVGDIPWAHIDLSTATVEQDTTLARSGATGAGAGTLTEYLIGCS